MKLIPLSHQGKNKGKYFAEVDDEMYPYVNHWKWGATKQGNTIYAVRQEWVDRVRVSVLMHRFILGVTDPNICVDHINLNGLCNLQINMRTCTKRENSCNRRGWKNSISQYKGVAYVSNSQKRVKRWTASITVNRKKISVGYYHTEIEAAKAYDSAALKYHKEFAKLNFA